MKQHLLVVFACLIGSLMGCAKPEEKKSVDTSEKPSGPKQTIGVSLLTLDNPFFKVIGDNITAEGAKRGYDTIVVSGDKDVAKQSNQIKDFIVSIAVSTGVRRPVWRRALLPSTNRP